MKDLWWPGQARGRCIWRCLLLVIAVTVACRQPAEDVSIAAPATASTTPEIGVPFVTVTPRQEAVVQTTPSPPPAPTATATPTPIVYEIQAGDTLLGIAWIRGISVEAIVTRNPGIQPELLQIGQRIELPPPATPLSQAVAGTPVPLQVTVSEMQVYGTPLDSAWILGLVTNRGEVAVENLAVEVTVRDAGGGIARQAGAWVALPVVLPGEAAPFAVRMDEVQGSAAAWQERVEVAVVAGASVTDLGSRAVDLTASSVTVDTAGDGVSIAGLVTNNGTGSVNGLLLVAILRDAGGHLTGYSAGQLDTLLAPGDNTSFRLAAAPPGGEPESATVLVRGVRQDDG